MKKSVEAKRRTSSENVDSFGERRKDSSFRASDAAVRPAGSTRAFVHWRAFFQYPYALSM